MSEGLIKRNQENKFFIVLLLLLSKCQVGSSEHQHYKLFLDHISSVINKGKVCMVFLTFKGKAPIHV